jgi:spore germination protein KB
MEKVQVNALQMFVLIVLFELGSAILFGPGSAAKQDAWITNLLGLAGGLLLFFVYDPTSYHRLFSKSKAKGRTLNF